MPLKRENCLSRIRPFYNADMSHDGITHFNVIDFLLGKVDLYIS